MGKDQTTSIKKFSKTFHEDHLRPWFDLLTLDTIHENQAEILNF